MQSSCHVTKRYMQAVVNVSIKIAVSEASLSGYMYKRDISLYLFPHSPPYLKKVTVKVVGGFSQIVFHPSSIQNVSGFCFAKFQGSHVSFSKIATEFQRRWKKSDLWKRTRTFILNHKGFCFLLHPRDFKKAEKRWWGDFHKLYSTQVMNSLNDDNDNGIVTQVDSKCLWKRTRKFILNHKGLCFLLHPRDFKKAEKRSLYHFS